MHFRTSSEFICGDGAHPLSALLHTFVISSNDWLINWLIDELTDQKEIVYDKSGCPPEHSNAWSILVILVLIAVYVSKDPSHLSSVSMTTYENLEKYT